MSSVVHPESISDARRDLTKTVERFRAQGVESKPVVFGRRRRAEAVVLPYETYEMLMDIVEDAVIARRVLERDARDTGARTPLEDVAAEFEVDLEDL